MTNNKVGYYALAEQLASEEYREFLKYVENYGIYQPDTLTLRGTVPDPAQITPIGLNGGRLAEAMSDLITYVDGDLMIGGVCESLGSSMGYSELWIVAATAS